METIESKIKVDISSAAFGWVKGIDFQTPNGNFVHTLREDDTNAIIYSTCVYLSKERGIIPNTLQPMDLLTHVYQYIPIYTSYLCQYALMKRGISLTQEIVESINQRVISQTVDQKFWVYILSKMSGSHDHFFLYNSIMNLCFNAEQPADFVDTIISDFLPIETGLKTIEEFTSGMNVCGITLVERLSKKDHSEVWKGSERGRPVAIKMEPFDVDGKELSKLLKSKESAKIIEHIQETDEEFINFNTKLRSFPQKVSSFRVDYYGPLHMKVKIMTFLEGPVGKINVDDKKDFIRNMINGLFALHSAGIVFGDISLHHIMMSSTKEGGSAYKYVDYKQVKNIGETSTLTHGKYRSLLLLSQRHDTLRLTPYHDIESLLYVFNDIIAGKETQYADLNDEIQKKTNLSTFSAIVAEAITNLRMLMTFDPDPFFKNEEDRQNHVKALYTTGFLNTNTMQQIPGIVAMVKRICDTFREAPQALIDMTYANQALLVNIRTLFTQDPRFNAICADIKRYEDITLKILNVMTTSVTYGDEDMAIINSFLM